MPKRRKTRKEKIQASINHHPVSKTHAGISSETPVTTHHVIKLPEKLSLQSSAEPTTFGVPGHAYLKKELLRIAVLSGIIMIIESCLYLLLRNHLVVLPYVSY